MGALVIGDVGLSWLGFHGIPQDKSGGSRVYALRVPPEIRATMGRYLRPAYEICTELGGYVYCSEGVVREMARHGKLDNFGIRSNGQLTMEGHRTVYGGCGTGVYLNENCMPDVHTPVTVNLEQQSVL